MARVFQNNDPYVDLSPYLAGKPLDWHWVKLADWPAHWIDHPSRPLDAPSVAMFKLEFQVEKAQSARFHVSADNRYWLFLDGELLGRGPERGDVRHWNYETYRVRLAPGRHVLVAMTWYLAQHAPYAQMSWRPGFLLAAEGLWHSVLSTGQARWQVSIVEGVEFRASYLRGSTGASIRVDGRLFPWGYQGGLAGNWVPAQNVRQATSILRANEFAPQWLLTPATLPPMREKRVRAGVARYVTSAKNAYPVRATVHDETQAQVWNSMLKGKAAVEIPPHTTLTVLVDLQNYYCAYPKLQVSGGSGATITMQWAEGLCEAADSYTKGNRDEIEGKFFRGEGDEFLPDGGQCREFTTFWWAAGRYVELRIETGDAPLTIQSLALVWTGYPLRMEGKFSASDKRLGQVVPVAVRAMQSCAHETYMDCPYYEQLMYVGDTRLEALTTYVMTADDRLPRKALRVFDESRQLDGLTQSRYPSRVTQIIPPFSMWWMCMAADFLAWRGDPNFLRERLTGLRAVGEAMRAYVGPDNLMGAPHGWNFVDWVDKPRWPSGVPFGADLRASSILNLQLALALEAKARVEDAVGEAVLARRDRLAAARATTAVLRHFWDDGRGLIADDLGHEHFSEHGQVLALLTGLLPAAKARRAAQGLLCDNDLARTTIYFAHYLFEALYLLGRPDKLMERMELWFGLLPNGLKTTVEAPEPTRSDCHAWGAHPLYHYYASLLGIRPASVGFASVRIAPMLPESVKWIQGTMPHPSGTISVALERAGGGLKGEISLPGGVGGRFVWGGRLAALKPGKNRVRA